MPHIDDAFPSKYLRASDLRNKVAKVIISNLTYETIDNKRKLIMFFQGKDKGIVLNKTNATTIAMVYGQDTDDWIGGELELYPTMVDYQGKQVEAIRCRVPPRKPAGRVAEPAASRFAGNAMDDDRMKAPPAPPRDEILDDEIPF